LASAYKHKHKLKIIFSDHRERFVILLFLDTAAPSCVKTRNCTSDWDGQSSASPRARADGCHLWNKYIGIYKVSTALCFIF